MILAIAISAAFWAPLALRAALTDRKPRRLGPPEPLEVLFGLWLASTLIATAYWAWTA